MALEPFSILALLGITIILGYVGQIIFEKTKIPDIIWLMVFGILVGPVFSLIEPAIFISIASFLAALAIIIILFDAGLNMDFYQMVKNFPRSILIGITSVLLAIAAGAVAAMLFLQVDLMRGLLLGAILGGTSSAIVLSLTEKMNVRPKVKSVLNLESIFTDPLIIIVSIAIINIIIQTNTQYSAVSGVLGAFSIGGLIGGLAGFAWLVILDKLKKRPYDYILTLAILFFVYIFIELNGGSGAIAALFFGIVLGNGVAFSKMLKTEKRFSVDNLIRRFQSEVTFFIRSFFFVFLGLIATINPAYLLYGIAIAAVLILIRIVAVQLGTIKMELTKVEMNTMRTMVPRGLAAAVLAQYPVIYGIPGTEIFRDIVLIVILVSVIYTVVASQVLSRIHFKEKMKNVDLEPDNKKSGEPTISIPKQLG